MGNGFKDICFSYKCKIKVESAEGDFNNQVDQMTGFVDSSQLLFPDTPYFDQWAHEPCGYSGRASSYS